MVGDKKISSNCSKRLPVQPVIHKYTNSSGKADGAAFNLCSGQEDEVQLKNSQEEEGSR